MGAAKGPCRVNMMFFGGAGVCGCGWWGVERAQLDEFDCNRASN